MDTDEAIENTDDVDTPDIDEYYFKLRQFVRMVARGNGNTNALLIEAPHGLGKTYQITRTLADTLGYDGPSSVDTIGGYATPLQVYRMLYYNRTDGVVFFDDLEGVLNKDASVSLLKQATETGDGPRHVSWRSSTSKLDDEDIPEKFEFRGRVIMCVNDVRNNSNVDALKDRVKYYRLDFDYDERIDLIHEIAKNEYGDLDYDERIDCAEWIERNSTPGSQPSLRTLFHVMDCRQFNPDRWQTLAFEFVSAEEDIRRMIELLESCDSVDEAANTWADEFDRTPRTFYNRADQLPKRPQDYVDQ